jgi:hypothetical protein
MEQAGIGQVMARGNTVAASAFFKYSNRFGFPLLINPLFPNSNAFLRRLSSKVISNSVN